MDFKDQRGLSLIELIVVIAIMGILYTAINNLILTGGNQYRRIYDKSKAENEARIAMAFIGGEIRRNDVSDNIHVTDDGGRSGVENDTNILEIKRESDYIWIYQSSGDNNPIVCRVNTSYDFDDADEEDITDEDVNIESFDVSENIIENSSQAAIDIKIGYDGKELKTTYTLRSDQP